MTINEEFNRIPSKEVWAAVQQRDKHRCRYCGNMQGPFEPDHVIPFSKGGLSTFENIVVACKECNRKKHAKDIQPQPIDFFSKPLWLKTITLLWFVFSIALAIGLTTWELIQYAHNIHPAVYALAWLVSTIILVVSPPWRKL